jgi:outer membrane protein assembly factor BamB
MLHRPCLLCLLVTAASTVALASTPSVPSWPQFRGLNAAGVASGANPPTKIGPQENVRWHIDVPWSPSSPIVWGDSLFLTTFADDQVETRCYNRNDGTLKWKRGIKPKQLEEFHRWDSSPATPTPATDGRRIVSYFGSFGLVCYDLDGKERWRHPLPISVTLGKYGSGASPIIVGKRVFVNRDQHQESSLLAVDLETGAKVWEIARPNSAGGFSTPVLWRNNGVDEIVLGSSGRLKGYAAADGTERWLVDGLAALICTTPVIGDGFLLMGAWSNASADEPLEPWPQFLAKHDKNGDGVVQMDEFVDRSRDYYRGYDANLDGKISREDWDVMNAVAPRRENLLVAVKPGGRGDITESHVAWKFRRGLPDVASPLYYDGRLYLVRDGGLITCVNAATGEPYYAQERLPANGHYYASPVAAAGKIYIASVLGKVTVVKTGGNKPEMLHTADFGERILATPAIVGDRLYLRTEKQLWAF